MNSQIRQSDVKRALRLALVLPVLVLTLWAAAPPADAANNNCTYYSDATYTTVVGEFGYDCCNNRVARGRKTQYVRCSSACFLCVPPPPSR